MALLQGESPFFKLRVHRDRLIRDTLMQLSGAELMEPSSLRRQLRVEFVGEEVSPGPTVELGQAFFSFAKIFPFCARFLLSCFRWVLPDQGLDEGGVQKEFFMLLLKELFDPKYGMFTLDTETHLYWFNGNSLEQPDEFRLLGMLLGLALCNNVILDLHFPNVVYKKVGFRAVTFGHGRSGLGHELAFPARSGVCG